MNHMKVVKGLETKRDAVQDVRTKVLAIVTSLFFDNIGDGLLDKFSDDKVSAFEVEGLHVGDTVFTLNVCEREDLVLQMQKLLIVKCLRWNRFKGEVFLVRFSLSFVDVRLQLAFDGVVFCWILLFNEPETSENLPQGGLTFKGTSKINRVRS